MSLWAWRFCEDFRGSFLLMDTSDNFCCQGGCSQGRSTEGEAVQLDFSLPSGAAVSAGCGEQMQGRIPERQLCHGEMSGLLYCSQL